MLVILIIGLGKIGSETAKRASSFDLNVIAYDPYQNEEYFNKRKVTKVNLEELLIKSDYISLHCPLNKETNHIINKSSLSLIGCDNKCILFDTIFLK